MANNDRDDIIPYLIHRYGSADPFKIAEQLNVDVRWTDLGGEVLGRTRNLFGQPIVMLDFSIRESLKKYFVMGHELGHVLLHADVGGYYKMVPHGDDRAEAQADVFGKELMIWLFQEDYGRLPDTYGDLVHAYGCPEM